MFEDTFRLFESISFIILLTYHLTPLIYHLFKLSFKVLIIIPTISIFFIVKGLRNSGSGLIKNIQVGIQKCVDNGAKIVSLSLGSDNNNVAHETFFLNLVYQNILIIAASGNTGKEEDFFPASY